MSLKFERCITVLAEGQPCVGLHCVRCFANVTDSRCFPEFTKFISLHPWSTPQRISWHPRVSHTPGWESMVNQLEETWFLPFGLFSFEKPFISVLVPSFPPHPTPSHLLHSPTFHSVHPPSTFYLAYPKLILPTPAGIGRKWHLLPSHRTPADWTTVNSVKQSFCYVSNTSRTVAPHTGFAIGWYCNKSLKH